MSFSVLARRPARRSWWLGAAFVASGLLIGARARAAEPCPDAAPWDRLGTSAGNFARPVPLTLTALAVAAPFALAPTGVDQRLRIFAQRDLGGKPNLEPVSVWTPYVLGGGLLATYAVGTIAGSCSVKRTLAPVIQAGVFTFTAVSLLKLGVGRRWPNGGADPNAPDRLDHPDGAHDFAPFQRGFAGWPSGHTALMFAGAAAFRAARPDLGALAYVGYPLALGVAGGMWLGDHHYASDIVSGALLGQALGNSAGQSFASELGAADAADEVTLLPILDRVSGERGFEIQWAGAW